MDKDFFDTSILFVNKSSEQIMGYFNLLITACVLFYRKCINPLGTLVTWINQNIRQMITKTLLIETVHFIDIIFYDHKRKKVAKVGKNKPSKVYK